MAITSEFGQDRKKANEGNKDMIQVHKFIDHVFETMHGNKNMIEKKRKQMR